MRPKKQPPTSLWGYVAPLGDGFKVYSDATPTQFTVSRAFASDGRYIVRLYCTPQNAVPWVVATIPLNTSDISSKDDLNAAGEALLNLYRLTHCKSE